MDVIGINLMLKSVKEKADAEANKYYEALDAFLESVVDGSPQQDLAAMENGISELKMGIDERIIEMEKSSSDLRRIMNKHEEESRAKQEQQLQDSMSRRARAIKKHFKPTEALMPEKLHKEVKPEEFSMARAMGKLEK